ncbi:MAG: fluoride efflux transporter CrcB [Bacteroidales bacterium]
MKELIYIAIGGGAGSVLRYAISKFITDSSGKLFPWGTMTVNLLGCLIVGLIIGWIMHHNISEALRLAMIIGFCGGFTTFSSFSVESLNLLRQGYTGLFCLYSGISLAGGLILVYVGIVITSSHWQN